MTREAPEQVRKALDRAGIPSIGPTYSKFVEAPDPPLVGGRVLAVLEAPNGDSAVARVREAVGPDRDVGPAELLAAKG